MTIRDRREMKQAAAAALDRATYDPKKLVLIHAGVTVAAFLLTTFVTWLLQTKMNENAGLSGLGTRSMLETASTVLSFAASLLSPFWTMGFLATMLHIIQDKYVSPKSLLLGLQNFGPVLRLMLLQALVATMVVMVCVPVASLLFALLPQSSAFINAVDAAAATGAEDLMADPAVRQAAVGIVLLFLAIFFLVYFPVSYRLRMSQYVVMDVPGIGALSAMLISSRMTKGKCFSLFRLDLSFWWYYLVLMLVGIVSQLPILLPDFGVTLSMGSGTLLLISIAIYALGYLAVYYLAAARVEATYAVAYQVISGPYRAPSQPPQNP